MAYTSPETVNWSAGLQTGLQYVNEVTLGMFANVTLFVIYLIFLFGSAFVTKDWAGGFAVAGFVTFVIGLLFWLSGIAGWLTFSVVIAVAIVSFAILLIDRRT